MFVILHIVVGLLLLALVAVGASIFNLDLIVPAVPVILVVWAASYRDLAHTLAVALFVGGGAATMFGDDRGVYLLALMVPALLLHAIQLRIPIHGVLALAGQVVMASLLMDITFGLLVAGLDGRVSHLTTLLRLSPATALATGAFAIVVFAFGRLAEPLLRNRDEHHALVL